MVLGLVEQDGFVKHGIGDGVHASGDETHGGEIALERQKGHDVDEEFVGESQ